MAKFLADILGQERAVTALRRSLASGRVHHAWVFTGPEGVGKRTAAEAFARALLDPTTSTAGDDTGHAAGDPDPTSETQRLIDAGMHPDCRVINKEMARFLDDRQLRERKLISIPRELIVERLIEPIALSPAMKTGSVASKVFIVDEAELLNASTQNALLKTLEEPPPGSIVVLVTSRESALLPTVRSRCQRVVFSTLGEEAMRAWAAGEGVEIGDEAGRWALTYAQGSPGVALLAIKGGLHGWARTLEPMLAGLTRGALAPGLGAEMARLVDAWAAAWVDEHTGASKDAANKAGARRMLELLAHRLRAELAESAADREGLERAARSIGALERAHRELEANVQMKFVFEALAARLASEESATAAPEPALV